MEEILLQAYQNQSKRNFFYSANGEITGCEYLNNLKNWDWTPASSSKVAGSNTCMFPMAMGCKRIELADGKEWIEPSFPELERIEDLKFPDIYNGRAGTVLTNIARMVNELPENKLIRCPDIQSPLGIAELICGENLYFALVENKTAVHKLLEKITEFVIAFLKEVHRIAGKRLNASGFPLIWATPEGTMVSDDTMSLVSPEMHLEFSVPYINEIARQCGPLYYHSCTWRKPYFDNIHQIDNVRAYNWNPGNSDDPAEIIREFSGQAVLAPHLVADMHRDNDALKLTRKSGLCFADEADFLSYMMDSMTKKTCMYFWFSDVIRKEEVIYKIYELLDHAGFTPGAKGAA